VDDAPSIRQTPDPNTIGSDGRNPDGRHANEAWNAC